jgi:hypothetical protein
MKRQSKYIPRGYIVPALSPLPSSSSSCKELNSNGGNLGGDAGLADPPNLKEPEPGLEVANAPPLLLVPAGAEAGGKGGLTLLLNTAIALSNAVYLSIVARYLSSGSSLGPFSNPGDPEGSARDERLRENGPGRGGDGD